MEEWYVEYKVGGKVLLRMDKAADEDVEEFRYKCMQMLQKFEELHPEYAGRGHANMDNDWTTRQIW